MKEETDMKDKIRIEREKKHWDKFAPEYDQFRRTPDSCRLIL